MGSHVGYRVILRRIPHADSATCVLKLKRLSYPAQSIDIMLNILFILSALSANFAGGTCDEPINFTVRDLNTHR